MGRINPILPHRLRQQIEITGDKTEAATFL
jgi:hypothetical protein